MFFEITTSKFQEVFLDIFRKFGQKELKKIITIYIKKKIFFCFFVIKFLFFNFFKFCSDRVFQILQGKFPENLR